MMDVMGRTPISSRTGRTVGTVAVLAALLAPVAIDRDSFPLSTYPMYASTRAGESTIVTAQGITGSGSRRTLTPTVIGNSDDPLIVVGELRAALRGGRGDDRCAEIAERVASRTEHRAIVVIEIVNERHDTVEHALDRPSLLERKVRATCEVRRR